MLTYTQAGRPLQVMTPLGQDVRLSRSWRPGDAFACFTFRWTWDPVIKEYIPLLQRYESTLREEVQPTDANQFTSS